MNVLKKKGDTKVLKQQEELDVADGLYIIESGSCEVKYQGEVVMKLHSGECFGESQVLRTPVTSLSLIPFRVTNI